MPLTSEPASASSVRCTERSAPSETAFVQRAHGARRAHRDRDDLVDVDRPALLELHRRLDGMRVERVEVLLPAPVHAPRRGVDALLDGGVRHLFDQDADLHLVTPRTRTWVRNPTVLTDQSIHWSASSNKRCTTRWRRAPVGGPSPAALRARARPPRAAPRSRRRDRPLRARRDPARSRASRVVASTRIATSAASSPARRACPLRGRHVAADEVRPAFSMSCWTREVVEQAALGDRGAGRDGVRRVTA